MRGSRVRPISFSLRARLFPLPVMLYHKAGMMNKALDLAFQTELFGPLQLIADDLDASSDPALVAKCAAFFLEHGHFDKAVDLLAISQKVSSSAPH